MTSEHASVYSDQHSVSLEHKLSVGINKKSLEAETKTLQSVSL